MNIDLDALGEQVQRLLNFRSLFPEGGPEAREWDEAEIEFAFLAPHAVQALIARLRDAEKVMDGLVALTERAICFHEDTYRGGSIWEICNTCGMKWADDEGGKPKHTEPKELTAAHAYSDTYLKGEQP